MIRAFFICLSTHKQTMSLLIHQIYQINSNIYLIIIRLLFDLFLSISKQIGQ